MRNGIEDAHLLGRAHARRGALQECERGLELWRFGAQRGLEHERRKARSAALGELRFRKPGVVMARERGEQRMARVACLDEDLAWALAAAGAPRHLREHREQAL